MRASRDERGLLLAYVVSMGATCSRRSVGCVLVDIKGRTLSTGYNGPPAGEPHCIDSPCAGALLPSGTGLDTCEALHAEWNALIQLKDPDALHTAYITISPCVTCAKMLMNTGCQRIVFQELYTGYNAVRLRWERSGRAWIQIFARD